MVVVILIANADDAELFRIQRSRSFVHPQLNSASTSISVYFCETATKANSLVDRLRTIELPDVDDVASDLEDYLETVERAEKLDEKIEETVALIDKIVYELCEFTDKKIEIVEEATTE